MDTVLGLLGFAFFITCVIGLAAGVSYVVVKLTPPPGAKAKKTSEV
jgi:hypothetical protein